MPFNKESGLPKYLTDLEQAKLVNFIVESARMGYAHSRKEVLALAQAALKKTRVKW